MKNDEGLFELPGRHISLTGRTVAQMQVILEAISRGGRPRDRCYVCKREKGEDSVVVDRGEAMPKDGKFTPEQVKCVDLEFKSIGVRIEGKMFHYLICEECLMLIQPQAFLNRRIMGEKE